MKLPKNVRVKIGDKTALAIYPNIYLPRKVYINLKSSKPDPKYIAILIHEQKHLERRKKMGILKWGMKYIFSPKFRFNEEIAAIKASMVYLKKIKSGSILRKKRESSPAGCTSGRFLTKSQRER